MKVKVKRIASPKMPTAEQIADLCRGLSDDENEQRFLECCIALSLAVAPDDERSFYTVYGYACHFSDGFTQNTLEALRMWASGQLSDSCVSEIPDKILDNFRHAYLFKWQRRLIEHALLCYDRIKENADGLVSRCSARICEYALVNTSLTEVFNA